MSAIRIIDDHGELVGLDDENDHPQYQKVSEKGAAEGYASLGTDGLVPQSQLGSGTQDGTRFLRDDGTWQTAASRIADQSDFGGPTPGADTDGYALVWDNAVGKFVLASIDNLGDSFFGSAALSSTPDASGNTGGGVLIGTSPPTLETSPFAGFGNGFAFDGVLRGHDTAGIAVKQFEIPAGSVTFDVRFRHLAQPQGAWMGHWYEHVASGGNNGGLFIGVVADTDGINPNKPAAFWVDDTDTVRSIVGSTTLVSGTSYRLRFRFDDTTNLAELLLNGVVEASMSATSFKPILPQTLPFWIGRLHHVSGGPFPLSFVDEVRVSKVARTDADAAPYVSDADTLLLMHCDGTNDTGHIGAINGANVGSNDYRIGIVLSPDGKEFFEHGGNPVLGPGASGAWDDNYVKDPWLLKIGSVLRCYYSGNKATDAYQVNDFGLATSEDLGTTWAKNPSNPIFTRGTTGAWDAYRLDFPCVVYDASASLSRRWKMWYTAQATSDYATHALGYAYSADGIIWTKHSGNPVLVKGSPGSYDEGGIVETFVVRRNGIYYLYYTGVSGSPVQGKICLATFTDPEGTYTKHPDNPMLANRINATQAMTANLTSGSRVVSVADTSVFAVGEPVYLKDSASGDFADRNHVETIDSSTQLTLRADATKTYTTANGATIRSAFRQWIGPRSMARVGGLYRIYMVAAFSYGGEEDSNEATASLLTGPWAYDFSAGNLFTPAPNTWNDESAENLSVATVY